MPTTIQPRKPWLAALTSLVLPGFGQLYNGEANKAIWCFASFLFVTIPLGALVAMYLPNAWFVPALALATIGTIGFYLWLAFDAWKVATGLQTFEMKPWQISGVYLAAIVGCGLFAFPLTYSYVRTHWVEPFVIPSASMEPSVMAGDYLIADKRYNCPNCKSAVSRGDIVVFTYPNDRTFHYIKRVVALPGDEVVLNGRVLSVNGIALSAAEVNAAEKIQTTENWGNRQWKVQWSAKEMRSTIPMKLVVPAGQVFVMGDNRDLTKDSRSFGSVPLQDVIGRARQVWFSRSQGQIVWQRLGIQF